MAYTGLVKQLYREDVPCPLSFGPNRSPLHSDDSMAYMNLYREEATVAETMLLRELQGFPIIEAWYFRCGTCNLILPAHRMPQ